jgi:hypothetical protein
VAFYFNWKQEQVNTLTYHPADVKTANGHLGIIKDGILRIIPYDLDDGRYYETSSPVCRAEITDTSYSEELKSFIYMLNLPAYNEDTQECIGHICLVLPQEVKIDDIPV